MSADLDLLPTDSDPAQPEAARNARESNSSRGMLVALTSAPSSGAGDYAATSLQPSSTWSAGGNSGNFSWSYPIEVPPSIHGPTPKISLNYSSQSVDGRMAASNNQPSWIGEGFEWSPGFIERRYKPCKDDMSGGNNNAETGDLCWVRDNATMTLNGSSKELLFMSGTEWRARSDDATRVRKVTVNGNGDDNGESWVATTPDGTRYFFGSTGPATWTVPVFGNHANEPCHGATFATSDCVQAWRWMLDKVVDRNGNSMTFSWVEESNRYAKNLSSASPAAYTRGGHLQRIEYGTRTGVSGAAPLRVEFTVANRCVTSSCGTRDSEGTNWPDTPWDQECTGAPCLNGSPTFWTSKRLEKITTQILESGTTYRDVRWWNLTHSFPDPEDGTRAGLWLDRISQAGKSGLTSTTVPDIVFERIQKPNRVDSAQGDWSPAMNWWRIASIKTETGSYINVTYKPVDCAAPSNLPAQAHANSQRCYPVKWIPPGRTAPIEDWFHKYVVDTVTHSDPTGASPPVATSYDYIGGGAWRYTDDDGLIEDEDKTWSGWRGYATVRTTLGSTPDVQQITNTHYFRGMNGDILPSGTRAVTLPAVDNNMDGDTHDPSDAPAVLDEDHYAGMVRETVTFDGPNEVSASVSQPWRSTATATRTIGNSQVTARYSGITRTWNRTALDNNRGQRVTGTYTTFGAYGMADRVENLGDLALENDEKCEVTTYEPRNTTDWLLAYPNRIQQFATDCATATGGVTLTVDDIVGDVRTYYDGAAIHSTAPSEGNVTKVEVLKSWVPGPGTGNPGTPSYLVIETMQYDEWGRLSEATDVKNNVTTTTYTHNSAGQLISSAVTNPLGWVTTTGHDPASGQPVRTEDPNGRITEYTYDGMGRLTAVWRPGRSKATQSANITHSYVITDTAASTVTTSTLLPSGSYKTAIELHDAMLRPRQTQSAEGTTSGGAIVTDTLYDSAGRQFKQRGPYIIAMAPSVTLRAPVSETTVPAITLSLYDGAGRLTNSIFTSMGIEQWRTVTAYGGDRTDITPPLGGTANSTVTDARGNSIKMYQYHGSAPTPTVVGSWDETTYIYNRKDQLVEFVDAAGNIWTQSFDLRGRRTQSLDPDKGVTTSTYNDAGELVSTTDANQQTLVYGYDAIGRKVSLREGSAIGPKRSEWFYDALTVGGEVKGQLIKSVRYADPDNDGTPDAYVAEIQGFNTDYTPTGNSITIPAAEVGLAGTYNYAFTYWSDGSPSTTRLPDLDGAGGTAAEMLSYRYNHIALPETLETNYGGTATRYVIGTTYTRYGEPTLTGLAYSGGPGVEQAAYYEVGTRRLERQTTARATSPSGVADLNYSYDRAGNVTRIADLTPNPDDAQCFSYDHLRRLTEAWTPLSGDCRSEKSVANLGGPAPYWHTWAFDRAGNRTQQVEHGTTNITRTYSYPDPGDPQPHTLTQVTINGGTTGTQNYEYDANGNTTCRPSAVTNDCQSGLGNQTLAWNGEGQLDGVADASGNTSYVYDTTGSRLVRRDPSGKTLYLPGQELRYTTATGSKTTIRYYSHNGAMIATRTAGSLTWLSSDRHGTVSHTIGGASNQAIAGRRQTPYGTTRAATGTWPATLDKGFVGGTVDNTGLTHLGAREYDPSLGRFLSVDPIIDNRDPQQINPYAYSKNSPVTLSDPDGLRPTDDMVPRLTRDEYFKRHAQDHTRRHHEAARVAAIWIQVQVKLAGGNPGNVYREYSLAGGSKKGTGKVGAPDIVYVDEKSGVVYIWEVKKGTLGDADAVGDIKKYRPHLEKHFPGMTVRPGFQLALPPGGIVIKSPHPGEYLRVYNGGAAGSILYDVSTAPGPPPKPYVVPVPDRVPVPVPVHGPAPRTHTADEPIRIPPGNTTPTPFPTPLAPGVPYGADLKPIAQPWWVYPVAMAAVALLPGIVVGAAAAAPGAAVGAGLGAGLAWATAG
ncbi:RHS repeat domain-containing protein [Polymorphospora rubra]|uniref:RHS repeat domain-containing protein n=1 Tax=Polymorphospora rubra TaxID=338584 RepID=UPI001BB2F67F|nr:RHS repeat-associated core domain-containing protein [Polymorphospora rubra]